jgi:Arc/MetJ-type ribon-helix-helix transcriptional regulator
MTYNVSTEVESLIRKYMATGRYPSEDDLLRRALEQFCEDSADDDLQAIRTAIDEWQQGDEGVELDEAFDVVRRSVEKRLKS